MRYVKGTLISLLVLTFVIGVVFAYNPSPASADGHGGKGDGGGQPTEVSHSGNNSGTTSHNGDCQPSRNDGSGSGCNHNGGGSGNCGDNQGNAGGEDNGYGNGKKCGNASPTPNPKPTSTQPVPTQPTQPPLTATVTPGDPGSNSVTVVSTQSSCTLPEGPVALLPQTGTVYKYTANSQNFLVEAFSGDAISNHLSLVNNGLCFDVQLNSPVIGTMYTYKVTDMSGNTIAVFESGLVTKP